MATYIVLGNFTEKGIHAIKDTTKRSEAVRNVGKKVGVTVKDLYWTLGRYDVALIADAPDEAAMTAFGLSIGVAGNVRTETLRAFNAEEMGKILGKLA